MHACTGLLPPESTTEAIRSNVQLHEDNMTPLNNRMFQMHLVGVAENKQDQF
jgi:hypothetical protein